MTIALMSLPVLSNREIEALKYVCREASFRINAEIPGRFGPDRKGQKALRDARAVITKLKSARKEGL
jgi:hypothetical protein